METYVGELNTQFHCQFSHYFCFILKNNVFIIYTYVYNIYSGLLLSHKNSGMIFYYLQQCGLT